MPNVANITVAPTSRQPMMRRLLFWLLLVSQLSVGVLGARAAEMTMLAASQLLALHVVTAEMMDQHALRQISQCAIIDLPDADTVRPRKPVALQPPAVATPAAVPDPFMTPCGTAEIPLVDVTSLKQQAAMAALKRAATDIAMTGIAHFS
ncbi:hypothetical protein [Mariprofundus ferrooxydans]|uniref:hypothetical protein n=1 Tax=Mariprofundus ferrooxydans TaxID=314344 RepID=UPI00036A8D26|nr:hypothetical protein [Mariprofundus ferrooxydans]